MIPVVVRVVLGYWRIWVPTLAVVAVALYLYYAGRNSVLEEQAIQKLEDFRETTRNISDAVRNAPSSVDDAREWLRSFSTRKY